MLHAAIPQHRNRTRRQIANDGEKKIHNDEKSSVL